MLLHVFPITTKKQAKSSLLKVAGGRRAKVLTEVCTKINNKLIAMCRHLRRRLCVDLVAGLLGSTTTLLGNRTGSLPLSRALHIVTVWKQKIDTNRLETNKIILANKSHTHFMAHQPPLDYCQVFFSRNKIREIWIGHSIISVNSVLSYYYIYSYQRNISHGNRNLFSTANRECVWLCKWVWSW